MPAPWPASVSWFDTGKREAIGKPIRTRCILVVGAGYGGTMIRDSQNGCYGNAAVVAILDDDPLRWNSFISRVLVVG